MRSSLDRRAYFYNPREIYLENVYRYRCCYSGRVVGRKPNRGESIRGTLDVTKKTRTFEKHWRVRHRTEKESNTESKKLVMTTWERVATKAGLVCVQLAVNLLSHLNGSTRKGSGTSHERVIGIYFFFICVSVYTRPIWGLHNRIQSMGMFFQS